VKIKTLGIMHEDTLFGVDSAKVQEELAKKHGYEVVVKMAYRAKTTSLDAEVGKLKAANPDVFLPTSYTSDAFLFVKAAKNLDYNPKLLIAQNAGWTDPTFLTEMGKDAEGHITRAPFALDMANKKPMIKPINELFKKMKDNRAAATSPTCRRGPSLASSCSLTPSTVPGASTRRRSARPSRPPAYRPSSSSCLGAASSSTRRARHWRARHPPAGPEGPVRTIYPFDLAAADVAYPLTPWKDRK